ncbi:MAG: sigma-54-dependent Fis family transcriptional regulator [Calditrichaeota bacterium]|nr:sigma-54-dependent Fis family transcriptional regulator [Calditrichota bacterium]MCB9366554.1 sigma-54-dependent Fis family transcriptional regulator [Calditrichota bacterium]MCB9391188.1 sigma-54-dependent Fis family transcriptional regulator [Calditrichota bacterium]
MSALDQLIGQSDSLRAVKSLLLQAAPTDISVLIIGESGTGKELVARAIHENSARRDAPLLFVNCGAIPQGIFESEVFGHERGSFTGAEKRRAGYFEQAQGGTLVLDEIGEMPLESQVKLLRILESREIMRVGSSKAFPVDVRVLAATNVELADAVSKGEFRHDLYFRLKAVTIQIPPLRERSGDIPLLAEKFTRDFANRNRLPVPVISFDALQLLSRQYWPGNVRELKNTVESVLTLNRGVQELDDVHFRPHLASSRAMLPVLAARDQPPPVSQELLLATMLEVRREVREMKEALQSAITASQAVSQEPLPSNRLTDLEREQIQRILERHGGNRRKTAKELGIGERTLYRKLKEYDLG